MTHFLCMINIFRHRSLTVLGVWLLMLFLNYCSYIPTEWFFFTYFTFTALIQTAEFGILTFISFAVLMIITDFIVYMTVPFGYLCLAASAVVYAFLANGFHGLDRIGWLLTVMMTLIRFYIPWYTILPPSLMAPIAAHCTAFGICWLGYKLVNVLYAHMEQVCMVFGLVLVQPPKITVRNITKTGFIVSWTVPQSANIIYYLVEINHVLAGKIDQQDTSVVVAGLRPNTSYTLRVLAVSESNIRTPSAYTYVRTSKEDDTLRTGSLIEVKLDHEERFISLEVAEYIVDTVSQSPSNETVSSVKTTKSTVEHGLDRHGTQRKDVHTIEEQTKKDEPTLTTQEDLDRLREEINRVKTSHENIKRMMVELQENHQRTCLGFQEELERLREQRRMEEEARSQLRTTLKGLEEQYHRLDSIKHKRERELRSETNSVRQIRDTCHSKDREIHTLTESIRRHEHAIETSRHNMREQKETMDAQIRATQQEVKEAQQKLNALTQQYNAQAKGMKELRARLAQLTSEAEQLEQQVDHPEKHKQQVKRERRELYSRYMQLQEETKQLQHELREVTREKLALMEELHRVRRRSKGETIVDESSTREYYARHDGAERQEGAGHVHLPTLALPHPRAHTMDSDAPSPLSTTELHRRNTVGAYSGDAFMSTFALPDICDLAAHTLPTTVGQSTETVAGIHLAGTPVGNHWGMMGGHDVRFGAALSQMDRYLSVTSPLDTHLNDVVPMTRCSSDPRADTLPFNVLSHLTTGLDLPPHDVLSTAQHSPTDVASCWPTTVTSTTIPSMQSMLTTHPSSLWPGLGDTTAAVTTNGGRTTAITVATHPAMVTSEMSASMSPLSSTTSISTRSGSQTASASTTGATEFDQFMGGFVTSLDSLYQGNCDLNAYAFGVSNELPFTQSIWQPASFSTQPTSSSLHSNPRSANSTSALPLTSIYHDFFSSMHPYLSATTSTLGDASLNADPMHRRLHTNNMFGAVTGVHSTSLFSDTIKHGLGSPTHTNETSHHVTAPASYSVFSDRPGFTPLSYRPGPLLQQHRRNHSDSMVRHHAADATTHADQEKTHDQSAQKGHHIQHALDSWRDAGDNKDDVALQRSSLESPIST
jgi:hypothetical protein